ncbi:MAG TPA: hypothetical protein VF035_01470 [Longimicrobiales bacterium]
MKISAYYDLALRPMAFNGAFLFMLALMLPGFMPPDNLAEPFFSYWGQEAMPRAVTYLLWRETLILPTAFGIVAGSMAASLRGVALAGTLPGVRRMVSLGTLQVMVVVLLITAYLHHGFGGHPLAAMGVASVLYAAWVLQPNGIQWNIIRLISTAALLLWFKPELLESAASAASLPIALLIPVSGAWLLTMMRDPAHLRRQALSPLTPQLPGWIRRADLGGIGRLSGAPNGGGVVSWFRTAARAGVGGIRSQFVLVPAWTAGFWSIFGYFLASPMTFMIYPLSLFSGSLRGLPGSLLYPVSRARRANVAYMCAAAFSLMYATIGGVTTWLMYTYTPFAGMMDEVPRLRPPLLTLIGVMTIAMPIAMLASLWPPIPEPTDRVKGWSMRLFLGVVVYFLCAAVALINHHRFMGALSPAQSLLVFALLSVLSHSIFLFILHRIYARRDLI